MLVLALARDAFAGAFIFAQESNGLNLITHPQGYSGSGGVLTVSVCIDPASPNASNMVFPIQQVVATWNGLQPTVGNLALGSNNDVPAGSTIDFESVALHEVGHCIGIAHPNAASESGLPTGQQNYTRATRGVNNLFDLAPGADGRIGSGDDLRGDDQNLHWYQIGVNDPFQIAATVDSTTYRRLLSGLPAGDLFAANADRDVSTDLGYPQSEAVMQQLTFFDEAQRQLTADDVATLRIGAAGLDEIAGNGDDYTVNLVYAGLTTSCDLAIAFDAAESGFAQCNTSGVFIGNPANEHARITTAEIFFNPNFLWQFTTCGDAVVDSNEQCDDGGRIAGDGCSAACVVESGFLCSGSPSVCTPQACGDGFITGAEQCDDGGTSPGDGCDAVCNIETGWACNGEPSLCSGICGDGLIRDLEQCDDGGTSPGDGCSEVCSIESGYTCSGEPSTCSGICGNGSVEQDELCDDGGTAPGDGCDALCLQEPGWLCVGSPSLCSQHCGNAILEPFETCDDGNFAAGDGCSLACQVEPGYFCNGEPSTCSLEVCGDGVITLSEQCDDGGTAPGDGCNAVCQVEGGFNCSGEPSLCSSVSVPVAPIWGIGLLAVALLAAGALPLANRRSRR